MTRGGIVGMHLDAAGWRELNRIGALGFVNVRRERARIFGIPLPWPQTNEAYRVRLWEALCARWRR